MMLDAKLDECMNGIKQIVDSNIFGILSKKEDESPEEEKQKVNDIKKNLSAYLSKKDYKGAAEYLKHVRSTL